MPTESRPEQLSEHRGPSDDENLLRSAYWSLKRGIEALHATREPNRVLNAQSGGAVAEMDQTMLRVKARLGVLVKERSS